MEVKERKLLTVSNNKKRPCSQLQQVIRGKYPIDMKPDADGLLRTQSQSVASFWSLAQNSTSESCYNDPRFRLADVQRIPH